jgi:hypothetical protein
MKTVQLCYGISEKAERGREQLPCKTSCNVNLACRHLMTSNGPKHEVSILSLFLLYIYGDNLAWPLVFLTYMGTILLDRLLMVSLLVVPLFLLSSGGVR